MATFGKPQALRCTFDRHSYRIKPDSIDRMLKEFLMILRSGNCNETIRCIGSASATARLMNAVHHVFIYPLSYVSNVINVRSTALTNAPMQSGAAVLLLNHPRSTIMHDLTT